MTDSHSDRVAAAFDGLASTYAESFQRNALARWARRRAHSIYDEALPRTGLIVDIGCGPGMDALALSSADRALVGIDLSPRMIQEASRAAQAHPNPPRFEVGNALNAAEVLSIVGRPADAAILGFGVIVDLPEIDALLASLERLVVPGGVVVLSTLNKWSWFDILWNACRLRCPPRLYDTPLQTSAGIAVSPTYRSVRELARRLTARGWTVESINGVGWIVPPPYVDPLIRGPVRSVLTNLDTRGGQGVTAHIADMVWIVASTPPTNDTSD